MGELKEGRGRKVKREVFHSSTGSNEAIRLRGTRSHLLFTQRTHTHAHTKLLPQLHRGPHFDYISIWRSYFCHAQITLIRVPSCGILTKVVWLKKKKPTSDQFLFREDGFAIMFASVPLESNKPQNLFQRCFIFLQGFSLFLSFILSAWFCRLFLSSKYQYFILRKWGRLRDVVTCAFAH